MSPLIARLTACAEDYEARHRVPRVAWDQLAADTWARRCRVWIEEFEGTPDERAIAVLRGIQRGDHLAPKGGKVPEGGLGFLVGIDIHVQIDRILDPVDQAKPSGYIEINRPGMRRVEVDGEDKWVDDDRPVYRRMLGVNHCLDTLMRGPFASRLTSSPAAYGFAREDETDEAWLERRRQWLSTFHPDTPVVRTDLYHPGGDVWQLAARVGDFIDTPHLSEPASPRRFTDFTEAA